MNTYNEKVTKLNDEYQNFVFKNRLLFTMEASTALQNMLFDSKVVDVNVPKEKISEMILVNERYGLLSIEFKSDYGDKRSVKIKPFVSFSYKYNTYIEVNLDGSFIGMVDNINAANLDSSDLEFLKKLFAPYFESFVIPIHNVYQEKKNLIEKQVQDFIIGKSIVSIAKNENGKSVIEVSGGFKFTSANDAQKTFFKKMNDSFFESYKSQVELAISFSDNMTYSKKQLAKKKKSN